MVINIEGELPLKIKIDEENLIFETGKSSNINICKIAKGDLFEKFKIKISSIAKLEELLTKNPNNWLILWWLSKLNKCSAVSKLLYLCSVNFGANKNMIAHTLYLDAENFFKIEDYFNSYLWASRAYALDSLNADVNKLLGSIYFLNGDNNEACEHYRKALQIVKQDKELERLIKERCK